MYVGLMHKQFHEFMTRDAIWKEDREKRGGLGKGIYLPDEFGWLMP